MTNKWLKAWMLCLLAITGLLLLWHHYGMNKVIEVVGHPDFTFVANDDRARDGASVASVSQKDGKLVLDCQLRRSYRWPYCELMVLTGGATQGLNLASFDDISVDIQTTSTLSRPTTIKLFLRNYDPVYANPDDHNSLKVNEIRYVPEKEDSPLQIPLTNFFVASWWIMERNLSPRYTATEMDNITMLAVVTDDLLPEGDYQIVINSIQFHGKWLSRYQISVLVIALWVLSALYYLADGFWRSRKTISIMMKHKQQLEEINNALDLQRQELETLALHDPLTGAYNRAGLGERLQQEIASAKKHNAPLSAAFVDLDDYKEINDRYGHSAGDEILQSLADFVRQNTRGDDFLCRWGGDEFILFLPGVDEDAAVLIVEKLRQKICTHAWPHAIQITCSFGVAQLDFDETFSSFIQRADQALYAAKAAGRNCVRPDPQQTKRPPAPDNTFNTPDQQKSQRLRGL